MFSNYRNSHQSLQYKRTSQKEKLLCSDYRNYVFAKTAHLPTKFNSSVVKVWKREKLKLFVWESLQWLSPCLSSPNCASFLLGLFRNRTMWLSFVCLFLFAGVILLFFKPRWGIHSRRFQLDVELFKGLFKLLLVPSKVGGDGIVEKDQLVVQYFHLWTGQSTRPRINTNDNGLSHIISLSSGKAVLIMQSSSRIPTVHCLAGSEPLMTFNFPTGDRPV